MSTKRQVRCAVYTRKSTEEGLEQDFNSLDAQREACEAFIKSQKAEGWICLRDQYDDGGFSGGTLERPALRRLLHSIENGQIDVVVVYKIDRLSRSLMDFAKLVEVFDRRSVTFVSVTQSFNTTTSMGRLTLNVLLSFAQFEREVTGERIRDKIAASKMKGIWMGGNPALGYDVANRKLVVNQVEAETVRLIFQRYLELGSVRHLSAELARRRIVSKLRTFANGKTRGGKPFGQSALYAILNNRIYTGETVHKGRSYHGEHQAIVSRTLFEEVQQKMSSDRFPPRKIRTAQDAAFAGLVFDEIGAPMMPTYASKKGIRYRYYESRRRLGQERAKAVISRVPAAAIEDLLATVLQRVGVRNEDPRATIRRIDIHSHTITIRIERGPALAHWQKDEPKPTDEQILEERRSRLLAGETLAEVGDRLDLILPVRAKFRGGHANMLYPADGTGSFRDLALIKALARAHRWREMLIKGEANSIDDIALRFGLDRGHTRLTLGLAFLSPAVTRAILAGEQPRGLRLSHLLEADIPNSWRNQDEALRKVASRIVAAPRIVPVA